MTWRQVSYRVSDVLMVLVPAYCVVMIVLGASWMYWVALASSAFYWYIRPWRAA